MSWKDKTWCYDKVCAKFEKCDQAYNKKESKKNKNKESVWIINNSCHIEQQHNK